MASDHYFSSQPSVAADFRPLEVALAGAPRRLTTSSGIFSPDRIDKGTAVLLADVPPPPASGNLLDIGCGWGPVALTLALLSPEADVYAVDVNERCVELTRRNAAALGLGRLTAGTPGQIDPSVRFDCIWSNPPIRVGKEELHALLRLWLNRLAPGGDAWLVVQKNLGADSLQRWIAGEFGEGFSVSRASTSGGFRLLRVHRGA
ncbi:methyltransferase [Paenarthrobacter sp. DKR-5]|uniref:class I SAM-dependent methyltransferase n=1 Tax=Paenarthrobacter sp. DKR-5 TaxID=2835535 RepID=UPI001BDBD1D4|nr:methyltransferase [Paenarthrobacter sp. DKR-5]MBT1002735.1 methyltransferase [Paenarthrobacter sp. DKR-5]